MSYEEASVIPTGRSTAAVGLYHEEYLNLQPPSLTPNSTGQIVVIWGGSTGVGSNAVQLAASSGCEVITTASPPRFDLVKSLGATHVFDYKSETAVPDIVASLEGKLLAGIIAIAEGSIEACYQIASQAQGNCFVASCMNLKEVPVGVRAKFIYGNSIRESDIGRLIWEEYFPRALSEGKFLGVPTPEVAGHGLNAIQLELGVREIPGKKVVVTL